LRPNHLRGARAISLTERIIRVEPGVEKKRGGEGSCRRQPGGIIKKPSPKKKKRKKRKKKARPETVYNNIHTSRAGKGSGLTMERGDLRELFAHTSREKGKNACFGRRCGGRAPLPVRLEGEGDHSISEGMW